jgi:TonB family protein
MGYQALLFCPDERLARVISQVFSELDFSVDPVHEPFAAVKRLMAQRYDAIVVDCDNEQNASLLFKSARNSSSNQSSLAIALVEGQAGVAKAYRIGANLVLTKPVNVEQAKGTLRVARGLLRKNSDNAGAAANAAAIPGKPAHASSGSSFQPASRGAAPIAPSPGPTGLPEFQAPLLPESPLRGLPAVTASAKLEDSQPVVPVPAAPTQAPAQTTFPLAPAINHDPAKNNAIMNEAAGNVAAASPVHNPSPALSSVPGSAAAPAQARTVPYPPSPENTIAPEHTSPSHGDPPHINPSHDVSPFPVFSSLNAADAPSFEAFGEEDSTGSNDNRKIMIAAVIVLALAVLAYFAYGTWGKSSTAPVPQPASAIQDSGRPAPDPSPASAPVASPSTGTTRRSGSATSSASKTATAAALDKASTGTDDSSITIALNPQPASKKPDSSHVAGKPMATAGRTQTQSEESSTSLPSPLAVASANDSNLSGLMSSASSSIPRLSLATVRISQGVSHGLLIKQVQPKYPQSALASHTKGAVQIEATINKEGNVTNLKVLSGDPGLARAAMEAVHQWRYKPYYLDGVPVEIQTQITVNFKAN